MAFRMSHSKDMGEMQADVAAPDSFQGVRYDYFCRHTGRIYRSFRIFGNISENAEVTS